MIKKFKLFEQLEEEESWWEEESPFDNIGPEYLVKSELIRDPSLHYVDNSLVMGLLKLTTSVKDRKEAQKIADTFNGKLSKYNMLYDEIDYTELKVGSVVMCNIPNVDKIVNQYKIKDISPNYWNARIEHGHGGYSILAYNIKSVIKY